MLDRQYSFDENGQHAKEKVNCAEGAREAALGRNGSENMIIHGDNLEALKALLPRYEGRVKCIYIEIILPSLIQRTGIIKKCAFAV